jgi:hypothetical protein
MGQIQELLDRMAPDKALGEIAAALKKLFPLIAEEEQLNFVANLIGGAGDDKVASMVHL